MSEAIQLKTKEFRGPRDGPHLLLTGGVHGDEYEPMFALRRLIRELTRIEGTLRGRVTVAPVVNEAAYWRSARAAEDGLDLARTCPGRPDGTITERTADALSRMIRGADFYIDLHTGGTIYDLVPLIGYALHPDTAVLDKQRAMARAFNLPLIWGTYPWLNGRSLSIARDAKVPALYAEYAGRTPCTASGVESYFDGCLNVMASLGMIERPAPASRVEFVVEDSRDQSGHLQVQHPSPVAGCFEPTVRLGQFVKTGDEVGVVTDVLGEEPVRVAAMQTGMVLMLRTAPVVAKGDALAVVIEIGETKEGMTWRIG